ncbi:hypothetical protein BLA27_27600 [Brucella cytisi]|uniref:Uncharacterized protein n=1 Tax=Brucella cytisi TaxID=407152 RepID=A0A1J6HAZ3_9HYPH|nr:hypothetical protein BLA27_27600 [Brucella cytisi]
MPELRQVDLKVVSVGLLVHRWAVGLVEISGVRGDLAVNLKVVSAGLLAHRWAVGSVGPSGGDAVQVHLLAAQGNPVELQPEAQVMAEVNRRVVRGNPVERQPEVQVMAGVNRGDQAANLKVVSADRPAHRWVVASVDPLAVRAGLVVNRPVEQASRRGNLQVAWVAPSVRRLVALVNQPGNRLVEQASRRANL